MNRSEVNFAHPGPSVTNINPRLTHPFFSTPPSQSTPLPNSDFKIRAYLGGADNANASLAGHANTDMLENGFPGNPQFPVIYKQTLAALSSPTSGLLRRPYVASVSPDKAASSRLGSHAPIAPLNRPFASTPESPNTLSLHQQSSSLATSTLSPIPLSSPSADSLASGTQTSIASTASFSTLSEMDQPFRRLSIGLRTSIHPPTITHDDAPKARIAAPALPQMRGTAIVLTLASRAPSRPRGDAKLRRTSLSSSSSLITSPSSAAPLNSASIQVDSSPSSTSPPQRSLSNQRASSVKGARRQTTGAQPSSDTPSLSSSPSRLPSTLSENAPLSQPSSSSAISKTVSKRSSSVGLQRSSNNTPSSLLNSNKPINTKTGSDKDKDKPSTSDSRTTTNLENEHTSNSQLSKGDQHSNSSHSDNKASVNGSDVNRRKASTKLSATATTHSRPNTTPLPTKPSCKGETHNNKNTSCHESEIRQNSGSNHNATGGDEVKGGDDAKAVSRSTLLTKPRSITSAIVDSPDVLFFRLAPEVTPSIKGFLESRGWVDLSRLQPHPNEVYRRKPTAATASPLVNADGTLKPVELKNGKSGGGRAKKNSEKGVCLGEGHEGGEDEEEGDMEGDHEVNGIQSKRLVDDDGQTRGKESVNKSCQVEASSSSTSSTSTKSSQVKSIVPTLPKSRRDYAYYTRVPNMWNLWWDDDGLCARMFTSSPCQMTNHLVTSSSIYRKDSLCECMASLRAEHGNAFSFTPLTFVLPHKWPYLRNAVLGEKGDASITRDKRLINGKRASGEGKEGGNSAYEKSKTVWIHKPVAAARGHGIFVFDDLSNFETKWTAAGRPACVVQQYVHPPYLLGKRIKYKFDLRLYVLVESVWPLRLYIHRRGIVRISSRPYDPTDLSNTLAHLTNFSLSKKTEQQATANKRASTSTSSTSSSTSSTSSSAASPCAKTNTPTTPASTGTTLPHEEAASLDDDPLSGDSGCKWDLDRLWEVLERDGINTHLLWQRIKNVALLTAIPLLRSAIPDSQSMGGLSGSNTSSNSWHTNSSSSDNNHLHTNSLRYELWGMDILLDDQCNPWLLEVNMSPAMLVSTPVDKRVKTKLLHDLFNLLKVEELLLSNKRATMTRASSPTNPKTASSSKPSSSSSTTKPCSPMCQEDEADKTNDTTRLVPVAASTPPPPPSPPSTSTWKLYPNTSSEKETGLTPLKSSRRPSVQSNSHNQKINTPIKDGINPDPNSKATGTPSISESQTAQSPSLTSPTATPRRSTTHSHLSLAPGPIGPNEFEPIFPFPTDPLTLRIRRQSVSSNTLPPTDPPLSVPQNMHPSSIPPITLTHSPALPTPTPPHAATNSRITKAANALNKRANTMAASILRGTWRIRRERDEGMGGAKEETKTSANGETETNDNVVLMGKACTMPATPEAVAAMTRNLVAYVTAWNKAVMKKKKST